jgi:mannose-1-phosphate guanylyltransferase/phosphomannomutase
MERNMKAVILAGGKGTRLRPFTHVVPKPLLPFKERPILEHVILYLKNYGITDIIVTISHLGYQIKNYFGDGSNLGVHIEYFEEKEPLGTAGCLLPFKDKLDETFLVLGGDNLTTLKLDEFMRFHREKKGIATIAIFEFEEKTKWGIYELDGECRVDKFLEKPVFKHNAGTMIFCLEPGIFRFIPQQKGAVNLTDHVIPKLLQSGEKLFGFRFSDFWLDIGSMDDYNKILNGEH